MRHLGECGDVKERFSCYNGDAMRCGGTVSYVYDD